MNPYQSSEAVPLQSSGSARVATIVLHCVCAVLYVSGACYASDNHHIPLVGGCMSGFGWHAAFAFQAFLCGIYEDKT